jgi:hypothetical protein
MSLGFKSNNKLEKSSKNIRLIPIFLGYLGFLFSFFFFDPSFGKEVYPGGDVGYDAGWVIEMSESKVPVTFGGSSVIGLGHPGPIYLWLAAIGYSVYGYLGWYVIWVIACSLLWLIAGIMLSKKFGNFLPLFGLFLGYVLADRFNGFDGIALDWTEDPTLSQSFLLAAIAVTIYSNKRWSGPLAVAFSVLSVSVWANVFFVQIPLLVYGLYRCFKNRDLSKGKPFLTLTGILLLVFGTFTVRWMQYGVKFPIDYVNAMIKFRTNETGGSPGEVMNYFISGLWWNLPERLAWWIWVTVISLSLVISLLKKSTPFIIVTFSALIASFTAIVVPTRSETHIVSIAGLIPVVALALLFGFIGKGLIKISKNKVILYIIYSMIFTLSLLIFKSDPTNVVRYTDSMQSISSTKEVVTKLIISGELERFKEEPIRVIIDPSTEYKPYYEVGLKNSINLELYRRGYQSCRDYGDDIPGKGGAVSKKMKCNSYDSIPAYDLVIQPSGNIANEIVSVIAVDRLLQQEIKVTLSKRIN